jgi:catechol 2,3-dioxygenase-like lactoylglutathione lyase family enzyme
LALALAAGAGSAALLSGAELSSGGAQSAGSMSPEPAIVAGVDHIPIAVRDLDAAAARYRALGFALKSGTPHANGIRNQHVKFRDGTELELITALEARDSLTAYYRSHLAGGDGPAFLALYAPDRARLVARLDEQTVSYRRSGALVAMPDGPLRYLFFGARNQSPTDRDEHFVHANTAESLVGVWIAGDDLSAERKLLGQLDVTFGRTTVYVPHAATADVAQVGSGQVVVLPGSHQIVAGRKIAGATLRVRDLDAARRALLGAGLGSALVTSSDGRSLFIPPADAHGLWLEFRSAGRRPDLQVRHSPGLKTRPTVRRPDL